MGSRRLAISVTQGVVDSAYHQHAESSTPRPNNRGSRRLPLMRGAQSSPFCHKNRREVSDSRDASNSKYRATAGTSAAAGTLGTEVIPTPGIKNNTTNNRTPVTAGTQATVETPATVLARQWCWQQPTALTDQKGMPTTQCLKQQRHQQQLGQGMPATTGKHKGLKIFFFLAEILIRKRFPTERYAESTTPRLQRGVGNSPYR